MAISADTLFINEVYIRAKTAVNGAVDAELMSVAIYQAQDMYIQRSLGTDLYNKLKTDVAAGTTAGDYLTLLQTYVMPAALWWTMVNLYPDLWVKHDNGGLHHRISDDTQYIGSDVFDRLVASATSKAKFYSKRLEEYLCKNSSLFTEFSSNEYPDISPGSTSYRAGGMRYGGSSRTCYGHYQHNNPYFP